MRTTKMIFCFLLILVTMTGYSQGFYKREYNPNGKYQDSTLYDTLSYSILWADNGVCSLGWELKIALKDSYAYPIQGWWWAPSKKEAMILLNLRWKNRADTIE